MELNIGVLSGKGGTGKTTVSTNLSVVMNANYIDGDVEEPNGFIFLRPNLVHSEEVMIDYPFVDKDKCILCGKCAKVCQYHALFRTKTEIMLFEKLCHGCHACGIVCKYGAISYKKRAIGVIEKGKYNGIVCKRGVLNVGEPMAVPVIKQLLGDLPEGINLVDCAPGTSCNVVNTLLYVDAALLVTEPSAFGLHDLKMALKLVRSLNLPYGVIINKYSEGNNMIQELCQQEKINVIGIMPYGKDAAETYSSGKMLIELPEYRKIFEEIAEKIKEVFLWS